MSKSRSPSTLRLKAERTAKRKAWREKMGIPAFEKPVNQVPRPQSKEKTHE